MKAMIFAAGLGTRLKPLTDSMPKALVPINGTPLLEHLILKMKNAGFEQIIINVHHFADQIIDFLQQNNNFGLQIAISDERNRLLETGGGLRKAQHFFNDEQPFLVHNVDILSNLGLADFMRQHQPNDIATLVVSNRTTSRYLLFNNDLQLQGWVNMQTNETKPSGLQAEDFQPLAFAGIQILSPRIFGTMNHFSEKFSMIDVYLKICQSDNVRAFVPANFQMLDVGKQNSLTEAQSFVLRLGEG